MAKCRWCGKGGFWVGTDEHGLCRDCQATLGFESTQRVRILQDCQRIVASSKNLATILSRCDVAIAEAQAFARFEARGIYICTAIVGDIVKSFMESHDEAIVKHLRDKMNRISAEADLAASPRSTVTKASKVLMELKELSGRTKSPGILDPFAVQIQSFIQAVQVKALVDAAEKAEFIGKAGKALDKYRELLYFLKTDQVEDSAQRDQIERIEGKIAALGQANDTTPGATRQRGTRSATRSPRANGKIPPGFGGYDPDAEI